MGTQSHGSKGGNTQDCQVAESGIHYSGSWYTLAVFVLKTEERR